MLVKAFLMRKDKPEIVVPLLFNPKELTVEKTNQFAEKPSPGLPSSIYNFVKGGSRTVTLDLFFDTYEQKTDVRVHTDKITGWDSGSLFTKSPIKGFMDIDSDLHAPPICLFVWGAFIFPCIIERVSKRFTLFLPEGIPVRATLNVTLKECRDVVTLLKETSYQSADVTKVWQVEEGENLWFIASKLYGSPNRWRHIANENKLHNPRLVNPGKMLLIPALE